MTQFKPKSLLSQSGEGLAIALVIIVIIVSGWLTCENFQKLLSDRRLVQHTNTVLMKVKEIESAIVNAETGQRGYLITSDEDYPQPYPDASRVVSQLVYDVEVPEAINTDPIRLRQILLNLVGNAIKFTDAGAVKVVCRYDAGPDVMIFDVIDTGIGIREQDQAQLFQPFVQADNTSTRSFGGTGLGLAICRRLAHALGGDVIMKSEYGKGNTFTLTINAAASGELIEPNLTLDLQAPSRPEAIQLNAKVLVVDDRRDIRYLAQHFIEKAGGTVVTATNGQEAIDLIYSDHPSSIQVIVMDMQMPVMDGYAATRELRRRGCQLPIIALTANAMKSDRDECLAAGCSDYTTKPLDSNALIAKIDSIVNKRP
ncbi:ATP-binding protein [Rubripirellula reticaptiva]|uniref:histidine kinase n=1 Tax=Rubripirellula reticaptiva TaxID=2528013 RepID=A0A5C6EDL8_9BACT|nr:ATP-binding protein [Rubripirellula reticaptiva]TWU46524.1 Aerobic respiration control sensor protein ArcB [Rubripirellula reticaptiva]